MSYPSTKLPTEPVTVGSDYSRWPMRGQLSLPTVEAGERNIWSSPSGLFTSAQYSAARDRVLATTQSLKELSDAPRS